MSAVADPAYDRRTEDEVPPIPTPIATDPLAGLIEALEARRDEVIDRGVHRIRTEIPEYRSIVDPAFVEDVRTHVALHHDAMTRSVAAGRPLERDELGFMRARATRRVGRIPLAAFLQAFRIYQEEFWDALLSSADGEAARKSAMEAAGTIIRYINMAAAEAGEVYLEAERLLHAQGERVRRDLLEDLLAGRPPAPGPKLTAARAAGLVPPAACLVDRRASARAAPGRAAVALRRGGADARRRLGRRPARRGQARGGRRRPVRRPPRRSADRGARDRAGAARRRGNPARDRREHRSRTASTACRTPTGRP